MSRSILGIHLALCAAALTPGALGAPPMAELGTFGLDPVALLQDGDETPGRENLELHHAHFTYRFSTEKNLETFRADPARFAVRQGGACSRMGALSGVGRPELWWVHDGSLYFAASEGCRRTSDAMPERVLETDDPPLDRVRPGEEKPWLDRAVQWMGGPEALLALSAYRSTESRQIETDAEPIEYTRVMTVALTGSSRLDTAYDRDHYVRSVSGDAGFFEDSDGVRIMDSDQTAEARRRLALELPVLLAAWARGDATGELVGEDAAAGVTVRVRLHGKTSELVLDPTTGEVLAQRFRGWGGEETLLGLCERRFVAFETHAGVRFPAAYESWYEGERDESADLAPGRFSIEVVPDPGADFFEIPTD